MRFILLSRCAIICWIILITACVNHNNPVSYYQVPLKCGAAPGLGCGSRIKPLFIDIEKEKGIKESWSNREGTVIAIVWNDQANEQMIQSLFAKNNVEAELIFDSIAIAVSSFNFREKGKWLKGMEVDQLSLEEAGVIAKDLTEFAENAKLISKEESGKIKKEIEDYFKKELVIVRTFDELKSDSVQERWMKNGYLIYEKHIGKSRADEVSAYYKEQMGELKRDIDECCDKDKKDACCKTKGEVSIQSEITCPKCGHKAMETMPTDICLLRYTCEKCKTELTPKDGDCCVFCTHGNHKCPSMQE